MRYAEVVSLAEWMGDIVVRLATARHEQMEEQEPATTASVASVAGGDPADD